MASARLDTSEDSRALDGQGHALRALERVAGAWDALPVASPMDQHIWARVCVEVFGAGRRLDVVTAGPEDSPAAVAVLFQPRGGPARLEVPGASMLGEPAGLAYADPEALADLCRGLSRLRLPIVLDRVPADSPIIPALKRAYKGRGAMVCRPATPYPTIPLDASWRDPAQRLSARRRADLRRAGRRAAAIGPVTFEHHAPRPEEVPPLLDEAFRIEMAGWKGRAGTALSLDPERGLFFRRYAAAAAQQGILRLCFLSVGGHCVAMQLAVEHAGRFWLLKTGYDEALGRCSPGNLLLLESIRRSAEAGLVAYEFLGGVEPWTRVWTQVERPCVTVRAYPASVRGLQQLAADGARYAMRRLRRTTAQEGL